MKFALQIQATLENIDKLVAANDFNFLFKFKCSNCGETSNKWHDIIESNRVPTKTAKSEVHYTEKCKLCARENSLEIVSGTFGDYTSDDQGKFKTIVVLEGRGLEPVEFSPDAGQWEAEASESNTKFQVKLENNEWVEYDEKANQSVGIYEFESKITRTK